MPALKTEITEIATGLGMLAYPSVEEALDQRPSICLNVTEQHWTRLHQAYQTGEYQQDFHSAFENGRYFLNSIEGLRNRSPRIIEWKGPHNPPGYDFLPADLRIDHVYLISCKYLSKILANVSPSHLFERSLNDRSNHSSMDWYLKVAEPEYRTLYQMVREDLSRNHGKEVPESLEDLDSKDRDLISKSYARKWPSHLEEHYLSFAYSVSLNSAMIWRDSVPTLKEQELLLWRMLRLNSSPYFILGSSAGSTLRLRVGTPWDFRQRYILRSFIITAPPSAQPRVSFQAVVTDKDIGKDRSIDGHVEIRWSHGRFCGYPEAKVYLDSKHEDVPGYFHLEGADSGNNYSLF